MLSRRSLSAVCGVALVSAVGLLTGCAAETAPSPSPPASTAAAPTASPTATAPAVVPDGTAEDNVPVFTAVVREVWAGKDQVKGRAYVDALVEAGFTKADMQVTRDKTSVGNPADSIQFSVLWDDECLVGQVGPSTKRPTVVVLPELPGGGCLIGETRPIDW